MKPKTAQFGNRSIYKRNIEVVAFGQQEEGGGRKQLILLSLIELFDQLAVCIYNSDFFKFISILIII